MNPLWLVGIFVLSAVLGYLIIRNVPALLHTPLMSGMNALSGITILGAMIAATVSDSVLIQILAGLAVILAMINIVSGFLLTHKMLASFRKKEEKKK